MRQITKSEAITILKTHGERYLSYIGYLSFCTALDLFEDDGAIFGHILSDDRKVWTLIAADSPEDVYRFQTLLEKDQLFAAIEDWISPLVLGERSLAWDEFCYTYHLPESVNLGESQTLPVIPLELAPLIHQHWIQADWTWEYILSQVKRGISSVKYVAEQPVAWSAIQDDGALGFMFVLPEHRKTGYAREVTLDLIAKVRAQDMIPFLHIVESNQASMNLAQSMGFERLKRICWMELA